MLNISKINNVNINSFLQKKPINTSVCNEVTANPSFGFLGRKKVSDNNIPSEEKKLSAVMSNLDSSAIETLTRLKEKGILQDKSSNDGSTVLDNMYNIATKDRISGLSSKLILTEVIKALDNPFSITQRFGDLPVDVAISKIFILTLLNNAGSFINALTPKINNIILKCLTTKPNALATKFNA